MLNYVSCSNAQSHDATIGLIRDVLDRGVKVTRVSYIVVRDDFICSFILCLQVFVDTVGPSATYQSKLQAIFPTLQFTVTSKADSIYPIVSAASIAAKVTRDSILANWTFAEDFGGENGFSTVFGSGYPSGMCCF
jgi:ribonuclease H2 subunit A